jgi:hypothetical protein
MKPRPPRLPIILLGAMTILTFGGPLAFGFVLQGGASPAWPPDRPIEWATLLGISGMVAALMIGSFSFLLVNRRPMTRDEGRTTGNAGNEP